MSLPSYGLFDGTDKFISATLVDCFIDVRVVGIKSQVTTKILYKNRSNRCMHNAVFQARVPEGATISSLDCFVEKDGEGSRRLVPREIKILSREQVEFGVSIGAIESNRDAIIFLRYDHNAVLQSGTAKIQFPLPGKHDEKMITRSREEGMTVLAWNGSPVFSLVTIDIEVSMPGRISLIESSTHSISSRVNWNTAKIDTEEYFLKGDDDFEILIMADNLEMADFPCDEIVEEEQKFYDVERIPTDLSSILRENENWDQDDYSDDCISQMFEKYFNGDLIPVDENVKFNMFPYEPKSLKLSTLRKQPSSDPESETDEENHRSSPQSFLDTGSDEEDSPGEDDISFETATEETNVDMSKPIYPLVSWYEEDSDDGSNFSEPEEEFADNEQTDRESVCEVEVEIEKDIVRDSLIYLGEIFVGTALAVNHRRPKLVKIDHYGGSCHQSFGRLHPATPPQSPRRWGLLTPTFGKKRFSREETLDAILDCLLGHLQESQNEEEFMVLDKDFAEVLGLPFETIISYTPISQSLSMSSLADFVEGVWANVLTMVFMQRLVRSHFLENLNQRFTIKFDSLYSRLEDPLLNQKNIKILNRHNISLLHIQELARGLFNKDEKPLPDIPNMVQDMLTPPATPP